MLKSIGRSAFAIMLVSTTLSLSCAHSQLRLIPSLENRTLDLDPDAPGFIYKYEECAKRFLGLCTKNEQRVEKYDLTDPTTRQRLIDMGFVAKVRERSR